MTWTTRFDSDRSTQEATTTHYRGVADEDLYSSNNSIFLAILSPNDVLMTLKPAREERNTFLQMSAAKRRKPKLLDCAAPSLTSAPMISTAALFALFTAQFSTPSRPTIPRFLTAGVCERYEPGKGT